MTDLAGSLNPPGEALAGALSGLAPKPSSYFPIAGAYTWGSPYGPRGSGFHGGQDLPATTGTPLVAVLAGRVSFQNGGAGGLAVNLDTADGTRYYYAHLSTQRLELEGKNVEPGTVLGAVGSTGNSSGPHLHFSIFRGGQAVDPAPFLRQLEGNKLSAADAAAGSSTAGASLAGIPNPLEAVQTALEVQGKLLRFFFDSRNWMRLAQIGAGAGLIVAGFVIIKRDAIVGTALTVTKKAVAGAATGGVGAALA